VSATAAKLRAATALVGDIAAMKSITRAMIDKAARMEKSEYTIALFGAFSAGKSSFANALIGERVLPVSPNPTTAAINKIVPPREDWPHGTARVTMKSKSAMLDDIRYSLTVLGIEDAERKTTDDRQMLELIGGLTPEQLSPSGKPHYSFLKAVEKGWTAAVGQLGTDVRADMALFRDYVAEEAKSCFVQHIELHYSCPITDQGIVLVDTPGADSINARHTGVAFNYIKNADAILFVTYYNHAFSQADREFLLQLGRVKESFELDKMFFVVNAADLASSPEELGDVVKHVETNLLQYGIRFPRVYPVSSLNALDAKLTGDDTAMGQSGIELFEREFVRFTIDELAQIAIQSAEHELVRSIGVLEQWITTATASEDSRAQQLIDLEKAYAEAVKQVEHQLETAETKPLQHELQELLYYVKQRASFRFGELYNFAFNPSSLRDDGRDLKKALRGAMQELVRLVSYDLSQELLATTLRLEVFMNKNAGKLDTAFSESIREGVPSFTPAQYEAASFATPEVDESIDGADVDDRLLWSNFKNPKAFFEGEGKAKLKAELETIVGGRVAAYADRHAERIFEHYAALYVDWVRQLADKQKSALEEHVEGMRISLTAAIDLNDLQSRRSQLQALLS